MQVLWKRNASQEVREALREAEHQDETWERMGSARRRLLP